MDIVAESPLLLSRAYARPTVPPWKIDARAEGSLARAHIPALDGLRGIAILVVMLHHFMSPLPNARGVAWWLNRTLDAGWCGVDLFFVLSGFLITGILFDAKSVSDGGDCDRSRYFVNFYARRTLRVFPLYYGVLLAVCLLLPGVSALRVGPHQQSWLWTYTTNLHPLLEGTSFRLTNSWRLAFGHFWSLAVEEQFYLVWPVVVLLFSRRALMTACCGLAALALASRIAASLAGASTDVIYQTTFLRMDGLVAGAWVALASRGPCGLQPLVRRAKWVLAGAAAVLAGLFAKTKGLPRFEPCVQTAGFSSLAVACAAVVLLAVARPRAWPVRRLLSAAPLGWLGRYSYGLYVFHYLLLPVFSRVVPMPAGPPAAGLKFLGPFALHVAGGLAGSFAVAWLSYHGFEKHVLKLKRFFATPLPAIEIEEAKMARAGWVAPPRRVAA